MLIKLKALLLLQGNALLLSVMLHATLVQLVRNHLLGILLYLLGIQILTLLEPNVQAAVKDGI